jgi:hypothetical protein
MKASPDGSHATTEESSFFSISMSLRGNGFDPVVAGEFGGDCNGDAAALPEEDVRVMRRLTSCEESNDDSLTLAVESVDVLDGDAPVAAASGLTWITPAPRGSSIVTPLAGPEVGSDAAESSSFNVKSSRDGAVGRLWAALNPARYMALSWACLSSSPWLKVGRESGGWKEARAASTDSFKAVKSIGSCGGKLASLGGNPASLLIESGWAPPFVLEL